MGVVVSEPLHTSDGDIAGSSGDAAVKGSSRTEISNKGTTIRILTRPTSGKSCEVIPTRNTRSLIEEDKRASDVFPRMEGKSVADVRKSRCNDGAWWDGLEVRSSDSLTPFSGLGPTPHKYIPSKSLEGNILGDFGRQVGVHETVQNQGEIQQSTPGSSQDNSRGTLKESFGKVFQCPAGVYPRTTDMIDLGSLNGNHQVDKRNLRKAFEDEHQSGQDRETQARDRMRALDEGWAPFAFKGCTSSLPGESLPTTGCVESTSMPKVGGLVLNSRTNIDVMSFSLRTKNLSPCKI